MTELELLAGVWAMHKMKYYLLGRPRFVLLTDHEPLIPMLNDQPLENTATPRLFRLREKIGQFSFIAKYVKGKQPVSYTHLTLPTIYSV